MPQRRSAPKERPVVFVALHRLAAPPAREKADREESNDDDDDPQDSAEDAPPFDDTRSLRPFDLIQERPANDEAPKGATSGSKSGDANVVAAWRDDRRQSLLLPTLPSKHHIAFGDAPLDRG